MFEVGSYVVFGTDGVCRVEAVGPLDMDGVSRDKIYYTLAPHGKNGRGTIFAPVDGRRVVLRGILTRDEAKNLIATAKDLNRLGIDDERKREFRYKEVLQSCDCSLLVRMIKEIRLRRDERSSIGKKLPAVDERYLGMAENSLFGELSVSLETDRAEVSACFDHIHEQ